ncbi:MAG: sensor histidine kinase [Pseudolysinimonas sp.]|uniref:sensor histidine kinase n=1 Tax=Pseudolysinimonas sp. TaxID=2680009 RepID=UPI003C745246
MGHVTAVLGSRWWALAVGVVVTVCAVLLAVAAPTTAHWWVGAAALAVFVVVYLVVGRRAADGSPGAIAFIVTSVVTTGALVSVDPPLAVFQALAMPSAWVLTTSRRAAIVANAFIAAATGTGFFVALGPAAATSAAVTVLFSFVGSVALGLWIWRIAEYGDERARLLDKLTAAQDELAALHRDAGVTDERERLARELHDTIAQSLAGVVLLAQRARRDHAAGKLRDDTLELVEDAARAALSETRTLVAGSAPVELSSGIAEALDTLAARFRRETSVAISCDVALTSPLDRDAEVVVLRCAQEGLANVRKHSGATAVRVTLVDEADTAVLRVEDDGRGLDPDAVPDGFGLSGLRARLALVGGTLELHGGPSGTTVVARIPRETTA